MLRTLCKSFIDSNLKVLFYILNSNSYILCIIIGVSIENIKLLKLY